MLEKGKEEDAEKKGDLVGGCVGGVDVAGRLCAGGSEGGVVNIDCVLDVGVDQDCDDRHAEELHRFVDCWVGWEVGKTGEMNAERKL